MIHYLLTLFVTHAGVTTPVPPEKYAEIRHYADKISCDRGGFQLSDDLDDEGLTYSWTCTPDGQDL